MKCAPRAPDRFATRRSDVDLPRGTELVVYQLGKLRTVSTLPFEQLANSDVQLLEVVAELFTDLAVEISDLAVEISDDFTSA